MRRSTRKKIPPVPITLRWHAATDPLPTRILHATKPKQAQPASQGQPWAPRSGMDQPFDFSAAVRNLLADVARRCSEHRHIQVARLLLTVTQSRSGHAHGLQARVTPLRFPKGELTLRRRGHTYHIQRYFLDENEFLYVMTFCLPRFLNQTFDQKFITLFHELHHIAPEFDGALRRHEGRYHVHSRSRREYDEGMAQLARDYLAGKPDPRLYDFLRMDFNQLQARHGSVQGIVVPRPKIVPLIRRHASAANIIATPEDVSSP